MMRTRRPAKARFPAIAAHAVVFSNPPFFVVKTRTAMLAPPANRLFERSGSVFEKMKKVSTGRGNDRSEHLRNLAARTQTDSCRLATC